MSKLPFVSKNLYSRWPCEYKWSIQPKINLFFRIIIRTSNVKCKNLSKIYFESIKLHFSSLFQLRLMTKISRLQQIALGYLLISMADSVLTALFKDRSTRILKLKSQLTFAIFAAVNHLSGSTCSKLKCVIFRRPRGYPFESDLLIHYAIALNTSIPRLTKRGILQRQVIKIEDFLRGWAQKT